MNPTRSEPSHTTPPIHDHAQMTFMDLFAALPKAFGDPEGMEDFSILQDGATPRFKLASYSSKTGFGLIVHRPSLDLPDEVVFEARLARYSIAGGAPAMEALLANVQQSAFSFNVCNTLCGDISVQRPVVLSSLTPGQVEVEVSQFTKNCLMTMLALADVRSKNDATGAHLGLCKTTPLSFGIATAARFPKTARVATKHPLISQSPRPACPLPNGPTVAPNASAPRRPAKHQFLGKALANPEKSASNARFFAFVARLPDLLDAFTEGRPQRRPDPRQATVTGRATYVMQKGIEVCVERNSRGDNDGEIHLHARLANLLHASEKDRATIASLVNEANSLGSHETFCLDDEHTLIMRRCLDLSSSPYTTTSAKIQSFSRAAKAMSGQLRISVSLFSKKVPASGGVGPATPETWIKRPLRSLEDAVKAHDVRMDPGAAMKTMKPINSYATQRKICLHRLAHFPFDNHQARRTSTPIPETPPTTLDIVAPIVLTGFYLAYRFLYAAPDPAVETDDVDPAY